MNFKERIKSAGFWTGLIGSVFLMLGAFGVDIGDETAQAIVNAVCSALVVFGIITVPSGGKPADGDGETPESDDNADDKADGGADEEKCE